MTSQLIGYNINAAESPADKALDLVRRSKARSHTVMNGLSFARQVYDAASKTTGEEPIIACREDWPDQDWRKEQFKNIDKYISDWRWRGGYWPGAYLYFLNEPVVGGNLNQLRSLLDSCIQFMEKCAKYKVKGVVGNFADASTFERNWIDAGEFDRFLRVASDWTNDGHGVIGHHNYTYGALWVGGGGFNHWNLKNPAAMTFDAAPTRDQMQNTRVWENWLQMRLMWPLLRLDKLGKKRYRFIITEGLWDRMPNGEIEGWITAAENALVGGRKLRGPLDQRDLWAKLWAMPAARAAIQQMKWFVNVMQGLPCDGAHLFTLNYNPEWKTFNFLEYPEFVAEFDGFVAEMIARTPGKEPTPAMNTKALPDSAHAGWRNGTVTASNTRVRQYGDINGVVVTSINGTEKVQFQTTTDQGGVRNTAPEQAGAEWVPVVLVDRSPIVKGWVRNDVAVLVEVKPVVKVVRANPIPPFVAQFGPGADLTKNDCLLAALCSMFRWFVKSPTGIDLTNVTPDDLAKKFNKGYLTMMSLADGVKLADMYGIPLVALSGADPMTPDRITQEMERWKAPVVALLNYAKLPTPKALPTYEGPHYACVYEVGLDEDNHPVYFRLHDPLGKSGLLGDGFEVPAAVFETAIRTTPGNSGIYQGLIFHPSVFQTQAPPEIDHEKIRQIRSSLLQVAKTILVLQDTVANALVDIDTVVSGYDAAKDS